MPRQTATSNIAELKLSRALPAPEARLVRVRAAEYMGSAQKRFFRVLLTDLAESLSARLKSAAAEIAAGTAGADPLDRASAEEKHQLAIAARARDAMQLVEVRAALKRIDTGEYGWCVETGEVIGWGRLLICPTAVLCIEAQQRRETKTSRFRN